MKETKVASIFLALIPLTLVVILSCTSGTTPAARPKGDSTATESKTDSALISTSSGKSTWQEEWENILSGAKKEGKVIVYGPPGGAVRQALTQEFMRAFSGISIDYVGQTGAAIVPRINSERKAGIYMVDLHIGSPITILLSLKELALPLEQFLILPEVKEGKYWLGGKLEFADLEGKYDFVFTTYAKLAMAYNPDLLEPQRASQLSYWDLTKPEWKGKVLMHNPIMGPGRGTVTFLYLHSQLGLDFLRALAKNEPVLNTDDRLMLEWVGRGKYPLAIAPSELTAIELIRAGLPIKLQPRLKEGTYASAAFGSVIYVNKAPHPNAARVYLNWLLSKEGQTAYSRASGQPSRRVDIPTDHLNPETLLQPGLDYLPNYTENFAREQDKAAKLAEEIFSIK